MYAIISPSSIIHVEMEKLCEHFEVHESVLEVRCLSDIIAREVVAHLNGEAVYLPFVTSFSRNTGLLILSKKYNSSQSVILRCSDGDMVQSKETLMRNFNVFEEHYACTSLPPEVPFPRRILSGVLDRTSGTELTVVRECLDWLRPKNKLLFLEFDPDGETKETIDHFLSKFTEDDHYMTLNISHVYSLDPHVAYLPLTKYGYILSLPGYSLNLKLLEDLIPEYPSYLALVAQTSVAWSRMLPMPKRFLFLDYNDLHRSPRPDLSDSRRLIRSFLALTPTLKKDELRTLATMLGYRHSYFQNEGVRRNLPYGLPYTSKCWLVSYQHVIEMRMEEKVPKELMDDELEDD